MSLLAVRGLIRSFGAVRAVDDVAFDVAEGERVAVIGPNGAGKSTLFNLLGGQLTADSGSIQYQGSAIEDLTTQQRWKRGIGRTFQVASVFASMTVRENVHLAIKARRGEVLRPWAPFKAEACAETQNLLEQMGMADLADRPCGTMAYGDAKRLELVLALVNRPSLLLMDEPTAGMAHRDRGTLMAEIDALVDDEGLTVLFTEHDMDVVFDHADRIIVMNRGRILTQGKPHEVRADDTVRDIYLGTTFDETEGDDALG